MYSGHLISPIKILSAQLADQIAAGEVIERPASVLKELIENSLDAGAHRIEVELARGGMDFLQVSDDGYGIAATELPLALCRHATSKINEFDDLSRLQSLGFRGEALASICSVSQWEIATLRTGEDGASLLRHDQDMKLLPANRTEGTTVSIRKLFFNTPARRKFLRAERTEFRHCEEIFRRMALVRFDVAFYLRHNGRQLRRLPAVKDEEGRCRRVGQLCGETFLHNSLRIDFSHDGMRLWGWTGMPGYSRQQTDIQFFYINGRIIRDRVINHALRLAYQGLLAPGRHAAFVLNLELDPAVFDINVHPTKHEVRFHEARRVHDFLMRCLRESLQCSEQAADTQVVAGVRDETSHYAIPVTQAAEHRPVAVEKGTHNNGLFGALQALILDRFLVTQTRHRAYLIDVCCAQAKLACIRWLEAFAVNTVKSRPLLIPQRLALEPVHERRLQRQSLQLSRLGFDLSEIGPGQVLFRSLPIYIQGFDGAILLRALLDMPLDVETEVLFSEIERQLSSQPFELATGETHQLLAAMARQPDRLQGCWRELELADLQGWLSEQSFRSE